MIEKNGAADVATRLSVCAAALAALTLVLPGAAAAKPTPKKVKVEILTSSQAELLRDGGLAVEVRGARAKVSLSARAGEAGGLTEPTKARSRPKGRLATLPLSAQGRKTLEVCGRYAVTVEGAYKRKRGGKGKRRKRTKVARASADLAAATSGCKVQVDDPNAGRCDPIDLAHCMAPFPNDYFTRPDGGSPTGLRVNLHPDSMPRNLNGVSAFSPEYNRNDGFSPNNIIATKVPGLDTPEAFKANEIVPQMDIARYADAGQRVLLIDADGGDRVPIWAELDMVPGTPNPHNGNQVQGTPEDRMLLIHPAVALDYGHRYIVALRSLTGGSGAPVQASSAFRAYRDGVISANPAIEARRPRMEQIFATLDQAGVDRADLNIAWDFTVASRDDRTARLLAMRDDAFAQLGDADLADGEIEGDAPEITITGEEQFDLCDSNGTPRCETKGQGGWTGNSQSDYALKKVTGTVEVPCYMNAPGPVYNINPAQRDVPCASGSRLHYEPGEDLPSQNGDAVFQAPFTCTIPRDGENSTAMATGKPGVVFGHGLLGDHRTVEALALYPASLEGVTCGSNWIGLSGADSITQEVLPDGDLAVNGGFLLNMLALKQNLALFSSLPDRSQQGFVNALYLGRAMAHEEGLADEPELMDGGDSALEIDQVQSSDDLGYFGVSLGGIFGAATTSAAPDWQRAALSVPGVGFTTLITRSTQFNQFLPLIYSAYPDPLARQLGISALQLLWDRGEPSSYLSHLTDDPLPGTPPHQVMLHEAFGDHQVTNIQTQTMARTIDADLRSPVVDPDRLDDVDYLFSDQIGAYFGLDQVPSADFQEPGGHDPDSDAVLYTFDTGPLRIEGSQVVGTTPNPDWNIAPIGRSGNTLPQANNGLDPHGPAATSPKAQQIAIPFLLGQGYNDACVSGAPPATGAGAMPPWTVPYLGTPDPCTAPPRSSLGQGE